MKKLPLEIYKQLKPRNRTPIKCEAKITMYKNQAVVHFPSILTSELGWKQDDSFSITVEKGDIPTVICKLKRGHG